MTEPGQTPAAGAPQAIVMPPLNYKTLMDEEGLKLNQLPKEIKEKIHVIYVYTKRYADKPYESTRDAIVKRDIEVCEMIEAYVDSKKPTEEEFQKQQQEQTKLKNQQMEDKKKKDGEAAATAAAATAEAKRIKDAEVAAAQNAAKKTADDLAAAKAKSEAAAAAAAGKAPQTDSGQHEVLDALGF